MTQFKRPIPTFIMRDNRWWYNVTYQGQRFRRTTKTNDREKAERMAEEFISTLMVDLLPDGWLPSDLPASALFDRYNEQPNKRGKEKNPATVENYKRYAANFRRHFGDPKLADLNRFQIGEWRDWLKIQKTAYHNGQRQRVLSSKTVAEHLAYVSAVYRFFRIPNACTGVVRPQKDDIDHQETLKFYTPEEINDLIARSKAYAINKGSGDSWDDFCRWLELIAMTGIRIGEAQGLRIKDIDWDADIIYVSSDKTRKRRPLSLKDAKGERGCWYLTFHIILKAFARHIPKAYEEVFGDDPTLAVAYKRMGKVLKELKKTQPDLLLFPYGYLWLYKKLSTLCKHCGITFLGVHALRHSFAARALRMPGWSIAYLAKWLGHEDISTTYRYYGHMIVEQRPAFSYDPIEPDRS